MDYAEPHDWACSPVFPIGAARGAEVRVPGPRIKYVKHLTEPENDCKQTGVHRVAHADPVVVRDLGE